MSGEEELQQGDELGEEVEGGEEAEAEDAEQDADLAVMQRELEKAQQEKAELDKLQKLQGGAGGAATAGKNPAQLFGMFPQLSDLQNSTNWKKKCV
jgi:hypothetical protein